ncbi:glycosyltransferase [Romboutsia sp. 1001713B170207_170306_H8]|uniref:glycosyltransferase n=1 Tax=Romboutsia sp. 1001713B170207_170306_H8 TaxID=2787112 RepID=UPI0008210C2B|nr:glycosyltransferase [Romboutsia sp. 1001713B170207_170306_H8]SCI45024.1 N-glycosyltransferase [uncultured Clostridium sp.]
MRVAFVILHYLAEKDTIECIKSIQNNVNYKDKWIIVVDNASTNNSFIHIKESYKDVENIILISNSKNLGFAMGNNVGYKYAKDTLDSDFIVLLNNDTIINQSDFCDVIVRKYIENSFCVLGPDIETRDGYHQNPLVRRNWTCTKLRLFKLKALIRLADLYLLGLGPKILERKKRLTERRDTLIGDFENIRLHGACLIFSPIYINQFEGLDDGTFLYMEEDLLQIYMDYYDLKMLYTSDLKILHKEDISTNMIDETQKEKNIRFLKNLINSTDICIDRVYNFKLNYKAKEKIQ